MVIEIDAIKRINSLEAFISDDLPLGVEAGLVVEDLGELSRVHRLLLIRRNHVPDGIAYNIGPPKTI